jgi:hypothetical protein
MSDCVVADDPVHAVGTGGHAHFSPYDIPEDPREGSFEKQSRRYARPSGQKDRNA